MLIILNLISSTKIITLLLYLLTPYSTEMDWVPFEDNPLQTIMNI